MSQREPVPDQRVRGRNVWRARLLWEPRDLWLGVFWDNVCGSCHGGGKRGFHDYPCRGCNGTGKLDDFLKIYICLLPCLPIFITRWTIPARCPSHPDSVTPDEESR